MRVAIYARHSTHMQEHSTSDQIDICKKWCDNNNYFITEIYSDEAVSGSSMINRTGINDLIDAAVAGEFEKLICEDLSRLSRDQGDIANFHKKLSFLDIKIETLNEGLINALHIGLKGTMNALFISDLAKKSRRGVIAAVLKGAVPGGKLYAYDIDKVFRNGEIVTGLRKINNEQAKIVKFIYDEYLKEKTLSEIADSLNKKEIPSPKGKKWQSTVLIGTLAQQTGILRQTLYKGVVTFNKVQYRKHPETGKRVCLINPKSDWISVPIPELAIISEKDFNNVQQMIEERSTLYKVRKLASDEEKKQRANERTKKFLAKERAKIPKKREMYLVHSRLFCPIHGSRITTLRHAVYGCKEKNCVNRNLHRKKIIYTVIMQMMNFDIDNLNEFNKQQEKILIDRSKKIIAYKEELSNKQQEITALLSKLTIKQSKGKETIKFLDNMEFECQRINYKIKGLNLSKKKTIILSKTEANIIHKKLHRLLKTHIDNPDEQSNIDIMHKFFDKIFIAKNLDTKEKDYIVDIRYNLKNLVHYFYKDMV